MTTPIPFHKDGATATIFGSNQSQNGEKRGRKGGRGAKILICRYTSKSTEPLRSLKKEPVFPSAFNPSLRKNVLNPLRTAASESSLHAGKKCIRREQDRKRREKREELR